MGEPMTSTFSGFFTKKKKKAAVAHELLFCQHFHTFAFHMLEALRGVSVGERLRRCPQALVRCG